MINLRWKIDGEWLIAFRPGQPDKPTRLARISGDRLALWDKRAHNEIELSVADLQDILKPASDSNFPR